MAIVRSQLLYQGFIVSRWADEFDEARAQLAAGCVALVVSSSCSATLPLVGLHAHDDLQRWTGVADADADDVAA